MIIYSDGKIIRLVGLKIVKYELLVYLLYVDDRKYD